MTPDGRIKLVSELLDLPLLDMEGKYCGVVDDVEFTGGAGKELKLKALLVGPGAYSGRVPAWAMWLVKNGKAELIYWAETTEERKPDMPAHMAPAYKVVIDKRPAN